MKILNCKKLRKINGYTNPLLKNKNKINKIPEEFTEIYQSILNLMEHYQPINYTHIDDTITMFGLNLDHLIDAVVIELRKLDIVPNITATNIPDLIYSLIGVSDKITIQPDIKIALK
jgi:hypothetical protein